MSACWSLQMPPTAKAVLVSLADNANDDGYCWPSIPKICERTCFSERAVHGAIKWLESNGLLHADRSNGRHTTYRLTPQNYIEPPQEMRGRSKCTPAGDAVTPAANAVLPPQEMQSPPQEMRSNRKEPSFNRQRTVNKTNALKVDDLVADGLDEQTASDWLQVRKAKKAPLTATAWNAVKREAALAGISVNDAVRIATESGWQGFKAEWILARQPARGAQGKAAMQAADQQWLDELTGRDSGLVKDVVVLDGDRQIDLGASAHGTELNSTDMRRQI